MKKFIFIGVVVLVLLFLITIYLYPRKQQCYNTIPKKIWTFWDDEEIPEIVKTCMDSWRRHCPDYEITLLNKESTKHIAEYKRAHDMIQRYSDFVRLDILSKEGGIWLDASIYLNGPMDWVHTGHEFVGFSYDLYKVKDEWPGLENWFIAASPNSEFIKDWFEEFKRINDYDDTKDYLESVRNQGIDFSKIEGDYLLQHIAAQKCIQTKKYDMSIISADKDAFRHLYENNWDEKKTMEKVCRGEFPKDQKLLKLRGQDRPLATDECLKNIN